MNEQEINDWFDYFDALHDHRCENARLNIADLKEIRALALSALRPAEPVAWISPMSLDHLANCREFCRLGTVEVAPRRDEKKTIPLCLHAAPPAESAEARWRPIESAPKDGTWLLVAGKTFRTSANLMICRWDGRDWESADDGYGAYIEPTHWQPIMPPLAARSTR